MGIDGSFVLELEYLNSGQSPARDIHISAQITVTVLGVTTNLVQTWRHPLSTNASASISMPFDPLGKAAVLQIYSANAGRVVVRGSVKFKDVFDTMREKSFSLHLLHKQGMTIRDTELLQEPEFFRAL